MRVVIAGGGGMLGHATWQLFRDRFDTIVTLRGLASDYPEGVFDAGRTIEGVDAADGEKAALRIIDAKPDVVVNCVGIIKQRAEAKDPIPSLRVNALFPHLLAAAAAAAAARVIHISTDCVFSGRRGAYREDDVTDADDLYGRTKVLGEVGRPHLTLRSSLIGRELKGSYGLVEWFLSRRGAQVCGYRGAVFSGVTTLQMARIVAEVIESRKELGGTYHVASEPITKYDLLRLLNDALKTGADICGKNEPRVDRTLDGGRFRAATGISAPRWPEMIDELAAGAAAYEKWRAHA
jgi:dTDP-4-dehydrorhamnose reductase